MNPYSRNIDGSSTVLVKLVVAEGGVVVGAAEGVGVVVVSSSSKRGRLNCPKASCMIVPPSPRLAGNNNRTLKLIAAIAALNLLYPKKVNLSFNIMTGVYNRLF